MRILITGGHTTPALAVVDELIKQSHQIYFVGRQFVNSHEKNESFEFKEVTARKISFVHLQSGRFHRTLSFEALLQPFYFLTALVGSFHIIRTIKPDAIISFGGYIALPVVFVAWLMGKRIITHEQTIEPGLANRIIAFFAEKVCVSFPETTRYFGKKAVLTGNPIRNELFLPQVSSLIPYTNRPLVLILGGSLGSHDLNVAIEQILSALLHKYTLVHQTGNIQQYHDFDRLSQYSSENYIVREHLSSKDTAALFQHAQLIVSRSGASTTFEIIAIGVPAVLVPLPWSARGEQLKHAELLKKNGVAEIWNQYHNPQELLALIDRVIEHRKKYINNFDRLTHYIRRDAAQKIAEIAQS